MMGKAIEVEIDGQTSIRMDIGGFSENKRTHGTDYLHKHHKLT